MKFSGKFCSIAPESLHPITKPLMKDINGRITIGMAKSTNNVMDANGNDILMRGTTSCS